MYVDIFLITLYVIAIPGNVNNNIFIASIRCSPCRVPTRDLS